LAKNTDCKIRCNPSRGRKGGKKKKRKERHKIALLFASLSIDTFDRIISDDEKVRPIDDFLLSLLSWNRFVLPLGITRARVISDLSLSHRGDDERRGPTDWRIYRISSLTYLRQSDFPSPFCSTH